MPPWKASVMLVRVSLPAPSVSLKGVSCQVLVSNVPVTLVVILRSSCHLVLRCRLPGADPPGLVERAYAPVTVTLRELLGAVLKKRANVRGRGRLARRCGET
jgi:hypothetical protein